MAAFRPSTSAPASIRAETTPGCRPTSTDSAPIRPVIAMMRRRAASSSESSVSRPETSRMTPRQPVSWMRSNRSCRKRSRTSSSRSTWIEATTTPRLTCMAIPGMSAYCAICRPGHWSSSWTSSRSTGLMSSRWVAPAVSLLNMRLLALCCHMVPEVDRDSLPANLNLENAIPSLIFLLRYRRH